MIECGLHRPAWRFCFLGSSRGFPLFLQSLRSEPLPFPFPSLLLLVLSSPFGVEADSSIPVLLWVEYSSKDCELPISIGRRICIYLLGSAMYLVRWFASLTTKCSLCSSYVFAPSSMRRIRASSLVAGSTRTAGSYQERVTGWADCHSSGPTRRLPLPYWTILYVCQTMNSIFISFHFFFCLRGGLRPMPPAPNGICCIEAEDGQHRIIQDL
ncbi:uncharacterized protein BJX67DRAFT_64145 [Aspergillus lucknowensis]|uniref:Uncharacterized protein n=1 Tax=Aspergillus lucknowensis TaxID=176173 RepID=A0ABR4LUY2_9EURO